MVAAWEDHTNIGVVVRQAALVDVDWTNAGMTEEQGLFVGIGVRVQAGLPRRSLGGWTNRGYGRSEDAWVVRMPMRTDTWQDPALPLLPIWPGFAINTAFYALILWVLFAAPFALRRRRRIRRGLCSKCGYDLRGSNVSACPECGTHVQRKASRALGAAPSNLKQAPLLNAA
ncbi:MAG: hypothetical protein L0219_05525 [Phycisphaerales bacterium]|nr:hypothetical protein [Phycisphaerales bacterium]